MPRAECPRHRCPADRAVCWLADLHASRDEPSSDPQPRTANLPLRLSRGPFLLVAVARGQFLRERANRCAAHALRDHSLSTIERRDLLGRQLVTGRNAATSCSASVPQRVYPTAELRAGEVVADPDHRPRHSHRPRALTPNVLVSAPAWNGHARCSRGSLRNRACPVIRPAGCALRRTSLARAKGPGACLPLNSTAPLPATTAG